MGFLPNRCFLDFAPPGVLRTFFIIRLLSVSAFEPFYYTPFKRIGKRGPAGWFTAFFRRESLASQARPRVKKIVSIIPFSSSKSRPPCRRSRFQLLALQRKRIGRNIHESDRFFSRLPRSSGRKTQSETDTIPYYRRRKRNEWPQR